jgi:polysaccharide biosynthesis transport protein
MLPPNPSQPTPPSKDASGALVPQPAAAGPPPARVPQRANGNTTGAQPPAALSSRPHLLGLLVALRRRWPLAVGLGLLCAAVVGGAVWYFLPSNYTVRTLLRTSAVQPKLVFETPEGRADFQNYQRSQMALIRTRLVLTAALRDSKVAELRMVKSQPEPEVWLEKHLQADYSVAPEVFRIALSGDDPEELKKLVTAVREAYLKEIADKEDQQRFGRLEKLKELYEKWDGQLQDKQKKLKEMAEGLGSLDPKTLELKQQFALAQLNTLQTELLGLQSQLRKAKVAVASQQDKEKAVKKGAIPEAVLEEYVKNDKLVLQYTAQVNQLNQNLAEIRDRTEKGEKDPAYTRALAAIETARKALAARQKALRPEVTERFREQVRLKFLADMAFHEEQLGQLKKLEQDLAKEVQSRVQDLQALKRTTIDVTWLRAEVALVEDVARTIGKQKLALEVETAAPGRVWPKPLEEAIVISAPSEAKRVSSAALAGAGTLGLVLFGIAWLEFRARRVNSVDEVVRGLGMRLVGTLPLLSQSGMGGTNRAHDVYRRARFTESLNTVRTTLLHTARQDSLRVIMVTSALPGEGKSLVSCHLAASLARAGYKTLLVDGDLRRPAVHKLFDLEPRPGLSELLRGEAGIDDAIRGGPVDGLAVLPAGQRDERTFKALAQGAAGPLWEQFKATYDFIVVDSPPVLAVADSLLIGQHADGVVFSVLRDVSRLPSIYAAYERLAMLNIRILGAVVNGAECPLYGSSYGYAYESPPATTS